ncbi:MAG: hypothetical protein HY974_01775 [Candidatus Kerfeldbacteria bacterium]|nr:hypothetical protein [Candidatus Kerfeldbacteria bacterium]
MSKLEQIFLVLILLVLAAGSIWVASGYWQIKSALSITTAASSSVIPQASSAEYRQAKQAENPNNPCLPPAGYTEESWREHMSHHPDEYRQCLDKLKGP